MNLATVEVKAFVPAADFVASKAFYSALGFEIPWSSDDLAYVHHGQTSFLLQAFNEPGFIENYQMHLLVENVDDWHAHVLASGVVERFGVRVGTPENQPWAMRDFTLFDPSGVLWRVAQNIPEWLLQAAWDSSPGEGKVDPRVVPLLIRSAVQPRSHPRLRGACRGEGRVSRLVAGRADRARRPADSGRPPCAHGLFRQGGLRRGSGLSPLEHWKRSFRLQLCGGLVEGKRRSPAAGNLAGQRDMGAKPGSHGATGLSDASGKCRFALRCARALSC